MTFEKTAEGVAQCYRTSLPAFLFNFNHSLQLHVLAMLFLGAAFAAAFALSPMAGVAPC